MSVDRPAVRAKGTVRPSERPRVRFERVRGEILRVEGDGGSTGFSFVVVGVDGGEGAGEEVEAVGLYWGRGE